MSVMYGPDCHNQGIRGYGNPEFGVVIVGSAPGRNDLKLGRPLSGTNGQLIDAVLEAVGWPRSKCYCTNLVCEYIKEPTLQEILACAPRFEAEIKDIKPKLIITLGKFATEVLTGKPIGTIRGCPVWNEKYDCWVMPTWHPANFLIGYDAAIIDIVKDLNKIKTILTWPKNIADFHYSVCDTVESAQAALQNFNDKEFVAVDVETDNKNIDEIDVYGDRLLCGSVSNGDLTYVLPYEVLKFVQFPPLRYTFHNGMFDTQAILRHTGIDLPIVEDTMLMSYALDERQGTHGLKYLAREYCGSGFFEKDIEKYKKIGMALAPVQILYHYNAADATYTARLAQALYPMMVKDKVDKVYTDILMPAANAFKYIQLRGVHVDRKKIYELGAEWTAKWLDQEQELVDMATAAGFPKRINTNSPKQLNVLLYDILHLPSGAKPNTRAETLEALVDEHPFVAKLMSWRRLDKMIGSYIKGIDEAIKDDRRVHANVLIHGTETGRLSYKNPPLQTIPKVEVVGEDLGRVREIFTPTDSRFIIVEADYSKSEIWGAYCHSKDPQMLSDLLSGDYHSQVASSVFNKPVSEVTKLERSHAKTVTFGRLISYAELKPSQLLEA